MLIAHFVRPCFVIIQSCLCYWYLKSIDIKIPFFSQLFSCCYCIDFIHSVEFDNQSSAIQHEIDGKKTHSHQLLSNDLLRGYCLLLFCDSADVSILHLIFLFLNCLAQNHWYRLLLLLWFVQWQLPLATFHYQLRAAVTTSNWKRLGISTRYKENSI